VFWQTLGNYEYEIDFVTGNYTGWVKCKGGRLANGHWPNFNIYTGETR
jgi:hypothetical protein